MECNRLVLGLALAVFLSREEMARVWKIKDFTSSTSHPASLNFFFFLPNSPRSNVAFAIIISGILNVIFVSLSFRPKPRDNGKGLMEMNAKNAIQMHHRNNLLTLIAFFSVFPYSLGILLLLALFGSYRLIFFLRPRSLFYFFREGKEPTAI